MSQAPVMPLFTDAYLADTMHLTTEEHGAYLLLLMATWRNNGQPLPDDPKRLARTVRVNERRWIDKLRPVLVEFFDLSEGTWRQHRLENEWARVATKREELAERGRKGGLSKRKSLDENARANCTNHSDKNEERFAENENHNALKNNETDLATASDKQNLNVSILNHNHLDTSNDVSPPCIPPSDEQPAIPGLSDNPTQPETKPKAAKQDRMSRLPEGFEVPAEWIEHAEGAASKAGIVIDWRHEAGQFINHHRSKGSKMADWKAAWRTWYGNAIKWAGDGSPSNIGGRNGASTHHHAGKPSAHATLSHAGASLAAEYRRERERNGG